MDARLYLPRSSVDLPRCFVGHYQPTAAFGTCTKGCCRSHARGTCLGQGCLAHSGAALRGKGYHRSPTPLAGLAVGFAAHGPCCSCPKDLARSPNWHCTSSSRTTHAARVPRTLPDLPLDIVHFRQSFFAVEGLVRSHSGEGSCQIPTVVRASCQWGWLCGPGRLHALLVARVLGRSPTMLARVFARTPACQGPCEQGRPG